LQAQQISFWLFGIWFEQIFYLAIKGGNKFYLAHKIELPHDDKVKVLARLVLLQYNGVGNNFLVVHHQQQAVESPFVRTSLFQERKAFKESGEPIVFFSQESFEVSVEALFVNLNQQCLLASFCCKQIS